MIARTLWRVGSIRMLDGAGLGLELVLTCPTWPSHLAPESLDQTFVYRRDLDGACHCRAIRFEDEDTFNADLVRAMPLYIACASDLSACDRGNPPLLMTAPMAHRRDGVDNFAGGNRWHVRKMFFEECQGEPHRWPSV